MRKIRIQMDETRMFCVKRAIKRSEGDDSRFLLMIDGDTIEGSVQSLARVAEICRRQGKVYIAPKSGGRGMREAAKDIEMCLDQTDVPE